MKIDIEKITERLGHILSPEGKALMIVSFVLLTLKFLIFDAIWCTETMFTPFSTLSLWLTTILQVGILMIPLAFFRMWKTQVVIFFAIDLLLLSNLWYFRTYFTAIPLKSYLLIGNLGDFTDSVFASMRWNDIVFPLLSVAALVMLARRYSTLVAISWRVRMVYSSVVAVAFVSLTVMCEVGGGFVQTIKDMRRNAYMYRNVVPCYSIPGVIVYDAMTTNPKYTAQDGREIETYLASLPQPYKLEVEERDNVVFILVESFESWVLNAEVEGQVITPRLNEMLRDSMTLYAPKVLTQVRAGRSIDGQLIYLTGLLPMLSGVHSTEYPNNTYPSIPKALTAKNGARTYLVTGDKIQTWNQKDFTREVGIDKYFSRPDYTMAEATGKYKRKRLGDRQLVRQTIDKFNDGLLWPVGEKAYLQIVTYSTHDPFEIPDELKTVSFSSAIPEVMANYMTAARYTDSAIGEFVDYLRSRPDYDRTLIVIVGDHEGLATHRDEIRNTPIGERIVSAEKFTPLIVLNSPIAGRYDGVMGQVDVYPSLMTLLGTTDYEWQGLGQSIFDPARPDVAIGSHMEVVTGSEFDHAGKNSGKIIEHLKDAHEISDRIITFDYLQRRKNVSVR